MKKIGLFVLVLMWSAAHICAQAVHTEVKQNSSGEWQIVRNGAPYYIKGGGGSTELDKLVSIGGNSFRTWSSDNAKYILDEAQKRGLTVMMGLWVQHERHGFDYNDPEKVRLQLEGFRKVVNEIKDHPALLLWGVGNEVDLQYTNVKVWDAVQDIAKMIHELDPHHPTCTVTAGLDGAETELILKKCPDIDIYGINTYGDVGNVKANIRKFGWTGPYIISEWGPNGHWEVQKTQWGIPVEQSSTEKANSYASRYQEFIAGDASMCIGSYVFLWGHKQETTSTWYGLFSEKGESSEAVDRLEKIWTGKDPVNACPSLDSVTVMNKRKGDFITIMAQEKMDVSAYAKDRDGDRLDYQWLIIPESTDIKSGGDAETAPKPVSGSVVKKKGGEAVLRAPAIEGSYRIFLFVRDGHNHYAYTNIPIYVTRRDPNAPPAKAVSFKQMTMAQ